MRRGHECQTVTCVERERRCRRWLQRRRSPPDKPTHTYGHQLNNLSQHSWSPV